MNLGILTVRNGISGVQLPLNAVVTVKMKGFLNRGRFVIRTCENWNIIVIALKWK